MESVIDFADNAAMLARRHGVGPMDNPSLSFPTASVYADAHTDTHVFTGLPTGLPMDAGEPGSDAMGSAQGAGTIQLRMFESDFDEDVFKNELARISLQQELEHDTIQQQQKLLDNGYANAMQITELFKRSMLVREQVNNQSIVESYLSFTKRCNLPPRNVAVSFKRSLVACFKLADTEKICGLLDEEGPSGDIKLFERDVENVYGDYLEWAKLLRVLVFDDCEALESHLTGEESDFCNKYPSIKYVLDSLQHIGASDHLAFADKLKLYILSNIKGLKSMVAFQAYLTENCTASFPAQDRAYMFTSYMADKSFSCDTYTTDLAFVLNQTSILETFAHEVRHYMQMNESCIQANTHKMQAMRNGRVRLRERIATKGAAMHAAMHAAHPNVSSTGAAGTVPASHSSQAELDSFVSWVRRARIPPTISHKHKLMAYALMALHGKNDISVVQCIHANMNTDIAKNVTAAYVFQPHVKTIVEFLNLLPVNVHMFPELNQFRMQCFNEFSNVDTQRLTWQLILQLYVCCYFQDDIWPGLWKTFCNIFSHQILIAVKHFRSQTPFSVQGVVSNCMKKEFEKMSYEES